MAKAKNVDYKLSSYEYEALKADRKNERALRQEYSRLRSIARKRLERLAESEYKTTQTYLRYRRAFTALTDIKKGQVARVAKKLVEVKSFLDLQTSTVSGQKEAAMEGIRRMQEKGYDFIKTPADLRKFGEFMDYNRALKKGGMFDSERVIEMMDKVSQHGIDIEQVKRDFTWWIENYQRLDDVPAPKKNKKSADAWKKAILESYGSEDSTETNFFGW